MSFKLDFNGSGSSFKTEFSSGQTFRSCMTSGIISGVTNVISRTTAEWNAQPTEISKKNYLYVYTDHQTTVNDQGETIYIPGVKIGDGLAYIIDLPFIDVLYSEHISNAQIHVTEAEKEFWNNKVTAYCIIDDEDGNLILTKDLIIEA